MLILTRKDIEASIDMKDVIDVVEKAFLELSEKTATCPPRVVIDIEKHRGKALFMPSYLPKMDSLATKIVSVYEENMKQGLPTVLASLILIDSRNGNTLAMMEGTIITALRTGAVSGVATKYLARENSTVVGVIGTGVQARTQIWAMNEVLGNITSVKAYDIISERAEKFAKSVSEELKLKARAVETSRECIKNSDVIITATTSTLPVLDGDWVDKGTHINSIGWMGPNARELDDEIIKEAKIIVDTKEGVLAESGDLLIPMRRGVISHDHIYAELSEIIGGKKSGRVSDNEITCFKSVGVAITDAATAKLVYDKAMKEGIGTKVEL